MTHILDFFWAIFFFTTTNFGTVSINLIQFYWEFFSSSVYEDEMKSHTFEFLTVSSCLITPLHIAPPFFANAYQNQMHTRSWIITRTPCFNIAQTKPSCEIIVKSQIPSVLLFLTRRSLNGDKKNVFNRTFAVWIENIFFNSNQDTCVLMKSRWSRMTL